MKEFSYEEFMRILNNKEQDTEEVQKAYKEKFKDVKDCAVLGIDIYRYGSMEEEARNLVPFIGQILRDLAIKHCFHYEKYLFQNVDKEKFQKNFINTGDGGYFIFDTPLHALVFAIYFETAVRLFNSGSEYRQLRECLKDRAILRYAMTYDKVYKYENSSYGSGIITNARMLSKDKLDRFLIDEKVYEWFMRNTSGIDNLSSFVITKIFKIPEFESYNEKKHDENKEQSLFSDNGDIGNVIKSINVQKIGEIKAKLDEISVYNLYIQTWSHLGLTVSLGNLNVSGISD